MSDGVVIVSEKELQRIRAQFAEHFSGPGIRQRVLVLNRVAVAPIDPVLAALSGD